MVKMLTLFTYCGELSIVNGIQGCQTLVGCRDFLKFLK